MSVLPNKSVDSSDSDPVEIPIRTDVRKGEAMAKPTARPAAPDPHADVEAVISSWVPREANAAKAWPVVGDLVLNLVRQAKPESAHVARSMLTVLAQHVAARQAGGHRLALEDLFSEAAVAESLATIWAELPAHSRGSYRGKLRWVAERVLPKNSPTRLPLITREQLYTGRSRHLRPHTTEEIEQYFQWASTVAAGRSRKRHAAAAIENYLNLMLGAGLVGAEPFNLNASDIARTEFAVVVRANGRLRGEGGRWVPVLAKYENQVAALANLLRPLGRYHHLDRLKAVLPEELRDLSPYRLRATWIQHLLATRIAPAALAAAGVGSIDSLLGELAPPVSLMEYQRMLRGTACCASCAQAGVGAPEFDPQAFPQLRVVQITANVGENQ